MNSAFDELANRYLEQLFESSPVTATGLGDHRFDHLLDEVDGAARERALTEAKVFLSELEEMPFGELTRGNQVDFRLLRHGLEKQIWQIETLREWQWNPLVYVGLPGTALYLLLSRDFAPIKDRLTDLSSRCCQLPRFFEQARESLIPELTPPIHAETAVAQNQGILKLIDSLIVPQFDELQGDARAALTRAVEIAREAIITHQRWLEEDLLPHAAGNARLSEKLYREKFSFDLFSSFSPEELRQHAEQQIADLHQRMYKLSKEICAERQPNFEPKENPSTDNKKDLIRCCLKFASDDAPDAETVVAAANQSLKITTDFVRENDLVTLPDAPVEIIDMPEFRRGVALAYCDAPGPLEENGSTFYAVSPPPDEWTDEQISSFLREYNFRSLHNLTVHEAMPGHYVQLLHSNQHPSRLRSVLASGTFIEGWAVYTEGMMMEVGFLPDDLLMRLVVLKWNLRGVVNALLDQKIHLDGIGEEEAMQLMVDDAFQENSEAEGKYRRAQLTSVQLSTYFAGYTEVIAIREAAEQAWGENFQLKAFHDQLMSFGSPPPVFVKALLLDQPIPS